MARESGGSRTTNTATASRAGRDLRVLPPGRDGRRRRRGADLPPFGWEDFCSYRSRLTWARELAAGGHPALRIDLPATGDSGGDPGDPARLQAWTTAVTAAVDWLRASTGRSRVATIGIRLGA